MATKKKAASSRRVLKSTDKQINQQHCAVMKPAAMPSCLGGGDFGINAE
jgi:hypothetical protein